jgi:hypothetical protein
MIFSATRLATLRRACLRALGVVCLLLAMVLAQGFALEHDAQHDASHAVRMALCAKGDAPAAPQNNDTAPCCVLAACGDLRSFGAPPASLDAEAFPPRFAVAILALSPQAAPARDGASARGVWFSRAPPRAV